MTNFVFEWENCAKISQAVVMTPHSMTSSQFYLIFNGTGNNHKLSYACCFLKCLYRCTLSKNAAFFMFAITFSQHWPFSVAAENHPKSGASDAILHGPCAHTKRLRCARCSVCSIFAQCKVQHSLGSLCRVHTLRFATVSLTSPLESQN